MGYKKLIIMSERVKRCRQRVRLGVKHVGVSLPVKNRKLKARLLKALDDGGVRNYKKRPIRSMTNFPMVRILRSLGKTQKRLVKNLLENKSILSERSIVKANEEFAPRTWHQKAFFINLMAVVKVRVIYSQNMELDDMLLNRLVDVLSENRNIIAINLGELGNDIKVSTLEKLSDEISNTNVGFMYISDHQVHSSIKAKLITGMRTNRVKKTSLVDWKIEGMTAGIHKMWFNGTNSKYKDTIKKI